MINNHAKQKPSSHQHDVTLPVVLYPSPIKLLKQIVFGGFFTGISIVLFYLANEDVLRGLIFIFAIWCFLYVIIGIIQLIPGSSYLILKKDGFIVRSMFKNKQILWSNVSSFYIVKLWVYPSVAYNFVEDTTLNPVAGGIISSTWFYLGSIFGFQTVLPDTYGIEAQELADLMNGLRQKYSQSFASSKNV